MPKQWITDWRRGTLPDGILPTDDYYTLFCEHDKPWEGARMPVSPEAVAMLRSIVGDFAVFAENEPTCIKCLASNADSQAAKKEWTEAIKVHKRIKQQELDKRPAPFGVDHYVLPQRFHNAWVDWVANSGPLPEFRMDFCPHGMIDFDPMMEDVHYLTDAGWKMLCEM